MYKAQIYGDTNRRDSFKFSHKNALVTRTCKCSKLILIQVIHIYNVYHIRESPPQFENRIMARVYVRSIMRSTMYQKAPFFFAGNGAVKISSVACRFSLVKIDNSDYPKSLISRINKSYAFFKKYRYSDILLKKT